MYGEWLVPREPYKNLLGFSEESLRVFLDYIENGKFVPCLFKGPKEHWAKSLEYSIEGEVGYALWGSATRSSVSGNIDRYLEVYFGIEKDKKKSPQEKSDIELRNDKLLVAFMSTGQNKIIGFGVITDLNLDSFRNFKGWKEGKELAEWLARTQGKQLTETKEKYWVLRYRIKVFWLHESIRRNFKDINSWQGEEYRFEGITPQGENVCYRSDNDTPVKSSRKFVLSKRDEILSTLRFYANHLSSANKSGEVTQGSPKIDTLECMGNGKVNVDDLYIPQESLDLVINAARTTNVLLVGPPGNGKTSLAKRVAEAFTGSEQCYDIVTANSLWFRRHVIGGESIKGGSVMWKSGILIRAYVKAAQIREGNYFLIIDEINRADIDKAFGEAFTIFSSPLPEEWKLPESLVEEIRSYGEHIDDVAKEFLRIYDELKREGKHNEPLKKIRIIATMNLVDARNLFHVGDALARRFVIISFDYPKGTEDLDKFMANYSLSEEEKEKIRALIRCMRLKLEEYSNKRREEGMAGFNISPATVKTALHLYSTSERRGIKMFSEVLMSTLGTLDPRTVEIVKKTVEGCMEKNK